MRSMVHVFTNRLISSVQFLFALETIYLYFLIQFSFYEIAKDVFDFHVYMRTYKGCN